MAAAAKGLLWCWGIQRVGK